MAQTPKDRQAKDGRPVETARRGRADAIGLDATRAAAAALQHSGFADPTLVLRWEEIAGPEVARLARPVRYSPNESGGVLTLKAEPGAALFLGHETRSLCERINAWLGRPAVNRLRFIQGSLAVRPQVPPPPKPAKSVPPADPAARYSGPQPLGDALKNLARRRLGTRPGN